MCHHFLLIYSHMKKIILTALCALSLMSCGEVPPSVNDFSYTLFSPVGAPTLPFYEYANSDLFVTNSTPANVKAQLLGDQYDFVIFDAISGLNLLNANNGNYRLARYITGGSFHLASISKEVDAIPSTSDYIVSFGENLVPDMVYKYLFPELESVTHYVAGVSEAQACLVSGLHNGNKVDYVFISEPALYGAMQKNTNVKDRYSIKDLYKEKTGQEYIPQAGLFVNANVSENDADKLTKYIQYVDNSINVAITDVATVSNKLNALSSENQISKFGFSTTIMEALQKDNQNRFGLVSDNSAIDINLFLSTIGAGSVNNNYIL